MLSTNDLRYCGQNRSAPWFDRAIICLFRKILWYLNNRATQFETALPLFNAASSPQWKRAFAEVYIY